MRHKRHTRIVAFGVIVAVCCVAFLFATTQVRREDAKEAQVDQQKQLADQQAAADAAKKAAEVAAGTQKLATLVQTVSSQYPDQVNIVITDLSNDATASYKADQQIVSASLFKLFVGYGIYRGVDNGTVSVNQKLTGIDAGQTVDHCLDLMITVSDNDCGEALGELIGWANLQATLDADGYSGTLMNNYVKGVPTDDKETTAQDVAKLLSRLYKGTLLKADTTNDFLAYLKADEINDFLPSGLPDGTVIAHKIGELYGYVHDAGIIYGTNKDMLAVMMSGEWNNPISDSVPVFAKLSSAVWAYQL